MTPFKNNISRWGWLRWFRKQNLDLLLQIIQGLEMGHEKALCLANVESSTNTYLKLMKHTCTHHHRFGTMMNSVPKLIEMEATWF